MANPKTTEETSLLHPVQTVEVQEEESVFEALGLNAQLFAFQMINFLAVCLIMWFLILKPLTKKMAERKNIIDESLDNAKKIETNLKTAEWKFQEKISEAKMEANKIISAAHETARANTENLKTEATKEIEVLVVQAKKSIQADRAAMQEELRRETAELATALAEKILRESTKNMSDADVVRLLSKT